MLTHLIILLDDRSTPYCSYSPQGKRDSSLMPIDVLRQGIVWAMKQNLNIQFVYPNYELPSEYNDAVLSIDHTKIKPIGQADEADIIVLDGWDDEVPDNAMCVIHSSRLELADHLSTIREWFGHVTRLNVVLTDVETFRDDEIGSYKDTLESLADIMVEMYKTGRNVQLNLLTDRLMLTTMNNCNAGVNNVTLAPNGKFYLCPAFYYDDEQQSVGDLSAGLDIRNQQLLRLDHAPICRVCDAYQCRRCIWMNERLTGDMNTPSHQQCVLAHVERNASRYLLLKLEKAGIRLADSNPIEEQTELDPFNIVNKWN